MTKLRNIKELQKYLAKSPEYEVIEKPSTTGKTKLLNFSKQHKSIIVVAGESRE